MNIPKKLDYGGGPISQMIVVDDLVSRYNLLIDYLQAKEEASKKDEIIKAHNKALDYMVEAAYGASKGEYLFKHDFEPDKNGKCWCNIPKESGYHYQIDPPEHEERQAEDLLTMFGSKMRECGRWEESLDYLRADVAFSEAQEIKVKIQSLGLGD